MTGKAVAQWVSPPRAGGADALPAAAVILSRIVPARAAGRWASSSAVRLAGSVPAHVEPKRPQPKWRSWTRSSPRRRRPNPHHPQVPQRGPVTPARAEPPGDQGSAGRLHRSPLRPRDAALGRLRERRRPVITPASARRHLSAREFPTGKVGVDATLFFRIGCLWIGYRHPARSAKISDIVGRIWRSGAQ